MTRLTIVNLPVADIYDKIGNERGYNLFAYGIPKDKSSFISTFQNHLCISVNIEGEYAGTIFISPVNFVIYDADFFIIKPFRRMAIDASIAVINYFCTIVSTRYSTKNNVILRGLTPVFNNSSLNFLHSIGFQDKVIHKSSCFLWKTRRYYDLVESVLFWGGGLTDHGKWRDTDCL